MDRLFFTHTKPFFDYQHDKDKKEKNVLRLMKFLQHQLVSFITLKESEIFFFFFLISDQDKTVIKVPNCNYGKENGGLGGKGSNPYLKSPTDEENESNR